MQYRFEATGCDDALDSAKDSLCTCVEDKIQNDDDVIKSFTDCAEAGTEIGDYLANADFLVHMARKICRGRR
ncbi:MAG: hypothetical protein GY696_10450 [Gammaproteobacteria bacterium]|nr:hypothetical protein [Gammaproteobacteria bacterium]